VKSATLVTALTRLTMAMAVAAPIVVFGFLYVLLVQPERAAARDTRNQLEVARAELNSRRALVESQAARTATSALDEFDARTAEGDRVGEVTDVLTAVLNGPAVGGISNLSIAAGSPVDGPIDSIAASFSRALVQTPVTVTFQARYDQVARFFRNLGVVPTTFDLQSVELTPGAASRPGFMLAKVSLLVFHRQKTTVEAVTTTEGPPGRPAKQTRNPAAPDRAIASAAQPDPVVTSILFSGGRRVARVDGRIVGPGDRLPAGVVHAIEPDAVVIVDPAGRARRFEIARPVIGIGTR
jgi:hypothetical protein